MTLWHRLIGRIVKDGIAAGTLAPATDPYALASVLTASLEGALMLARLYDDPAHMDRVVDHLVAYVETLRAEPEGTRTHDRVDTDAVERRRPLAHDHLDRSRAVRASVCVTSTATSSSRRCERGEPRRRRPPRCSGCSSTRSSAGRVVFSIVADEMHENPMGTMHGGIIATLVDTAMGCAVFSMLPAGTASRRSS